MLEQSPSSNNNYQWYKLYSDGWVEQGGYDTGTVGTGANDSSETYTYPIQMRDANYALTLGYGYGNIGGQNGKFGISAKTASSFTFRVISLSGNATGKYLSWRVSGFSTATTKPYVKCIKY